MRWKVSVRKGQRVYESVSLDEVVGATDIDLKYVPPSLRILGCERYGRHDSVVECVVIMTRWGWQRTFISGADSTSIRNEDVQTTEVCYSCGNRLLGSCHVTHVGREDEDLCSGVLAENRVSARIECCLAAGHQREIGAGEGVLQCYLGTNAARRAGDEHHLACESLRIMMDLEIDSLVDTWVGCCQSGGTSGPGSTGMCWTYSARWETLRSSSKPTIDIIVAIVDVQYVRD